MSTYRRPSDKGEGPEDSTTWQPYDWESKQEVSRLLERERILSEALGGPLPPGLDLPTEAQVLHIACGPGIWLTQVAQHYPSFRLTGIDKSGYYVQCACHYLAGLDTVTLQLNDIAGECEFLPTETFDLVYLRFLAAELAIDVLPDAVAELVGSCKHGAHLYWIEGEFPLTNSGACGQLVSYIQQGLHRQHGGSALSSATPGMRAYMVYVLHKIGCRVVQDQQHVLDISAGMPVHHAFVQQARVLTQQLRPLVIKAGVVPCEEYDAVATQALEQMRGSSFCGELVLHSILAVAP
ncbi:MAG: class I SAM-dependent methyltransferase [Chloroflexi bacterium]|nr:class I SAM-dependent methyltransferase [Chloroflexota bacterium]